MALHPAQQRAVTLMDRDVCVVAGAGSGKTSVLAERFAHLVLRRRADERLRAVDRVLALTFTEKAATEMRERVARGFLAGGMPDLRRAVETAWVSTFHSFCARLLRENAVEAGVDPSFRVLPEGDATLLLEEAREEAVARAAAERPGDLAPLARLAGSDLEGRMDELLADGAGPGRTFADLFAEAAAPLPGAEVARLRGVLRELESGLARFGGAAKTAARSAVEAGRALADSGDPDAVAAAAAAVVASFKMPGKDPGGALPAKPLLQEARAAARGVALGHAAAPAARALASLLDDAAAAYARRKAEGRALDFADLETRALALLEGDEEVREEARARFDAVLVDEFQDTSPTQERLLAALRVPGRQFVVGDPKQAIYGFRGADVGGFERARAAAGAEGTVPLTANFRSRPEILRFSNAVLAPAFAAGGDAQVPFQRLEAAAPHGPKDVPAVEVHLVGGEATLGDLRPREAAAMAARLRALVAGGEARITRIDGDDGPEGRALRWGDAAVLLRATTDIKIYERALADADVPYQVVKGRGFFEAREVVDLANLLQALEDPSDDLALAVVLRSPFAGLDDGALLALADARRPLGEGAPLSALLAPGVRPPAGLAPAMRARFQGFRALWPALLDLHRRGRLHETLDAALRESGYDLAVLLQRGGRQRAANLRKVRERARAFEGQGLGGPGEFLRLVRRLRLREERETEAPLAAEDAVALLTVHQAKGLEWPLVCIPDLGRKAHAVGGTVLVRGGRVGLKVSLGGKDLWTPLGEALKAEKERAEDAESVRLFHVALTRAKEHLLLSASVTDRHGEEEEEDAEVGSPAAPPKRVTWLGILAPHLPEGDGASTATLARGTPDEVAVRVVRGTGAEIAGPGPRRVSLAALRRKRLLAGRGPGVRLPRKRRGAVQREVDDVLRLPPVPRDGSPYLTTVSALLDFEACPLRYWFAHVLGVPEGPPAPTEDAVRREGRPGDEDEDPEDAGATAAGGVSRRALGVAVHAVLGTMEFARDGEDAVRVAAAARLREELDSEPPEEATEAVVGWVAAFRASDLGRRAAAAAAAGPGRLLREVPFLLKEEGVLLRGQIDLVLRGEDGSWLVADYKASPAPRRREKRSRYERQIHLYARALRAMPMLREAAHVEGALVYLDPAPEVAPVPLAPAALESARGLLARFAEVTRRDRFDPLRSHCPACPFGPSGARSCPAAPGVLPRAGPLAEPGRSS